MANTHQPLALRADAPAAKFCTRCERTLTVSDFARNRNRKDGLQMYCKECMKKLVADNCIAQPAKARARRSRWRAANRERQRETNRRFAARNREKRNEYNRKYNRENQEKRHAHIIVQMAIGRGELPPIISRECNRCGKMAQHYHHADYAKPLDVIPLCVSCHQFLHTGVQP